ncbi:TetR/AcrR family transcriptional regulator [Zavarzinia compransoris]|uniref:HTH tetR-type domain-containing protein n=1 Tax=Zavarzinia compransoris TaxID=1264899 RepID=A0A317E6E7_9PROT|nr:TetR/AcrR family transcriptional regulator [Zavarzinia compransoris]PWR22211.1 hypothetical protein DKG75_09600 [Zavarzinia compransoris]TDP47036.1 TetR family transcriptional regulator [Zavarzinia compransoris]
MKADPKPSDEMTPALREPARRRNQAAQALRAAKDALSRDHIMEVAERVFAEHGFLNARMQDVAREAGVSLATLYQFYPGKKELHRGVLIERHRQMVAAVIDQVQEILERPKSVPQLLWVMKAHLAFLLEHPDYLRLILQEGYAWYHAAAQPTTDEKALWEQGIEVMVQVLGWGVEHGYLVPGNGIEQARMMLTMQQTRLANWVAGGMAEDHAAVIARVMADFVRQFCRPAFAAALLTEDGVALKPAFAAEIDGLDSHG